MTIGSTKQYIGVIDMLCEGPIQGLVDGSKTSVYLNDVPFESADVVGSLTTSSENIFGVATLDCSGTSVTDVQGFTVTESDIGKFILVDVKSCPVNVTFQYNEMIGGLATLTGSDSNNKLTSDYTTANDNTSFVRIASSSRASIERDITVNSPTGNGSAIVDVPGTPTFQFWDTGEAYTVTLVKAVKIATVDEANNTFTIESSISSSALNNVKFIVQDVRTEDSDSGAANSQSTISKIDSSTVQFRAGELYQSAVTPVHSLSGGISITGAGAGFQILQSNDGDTDFNNNYGFTSYDIGGYPTGQSFERHSGDAIVIPSSEGTAPNFNLTTAQRSQVDEVNIRINYGTLITYDNQSGDKSNASAIYVFQIALNRNGSWSGYNTLFSQHGGKIVHTAKTTAPVSFGHTIGLTRFKPFDDFRIRVIRLTRPEGLPVWSNGSNGGKTNKDDWTCKANSSISGSDLTATIKDNLTYPYTANAAVSFSSKSYTSLPTRSYLLQGKKVRIPSSYTPREYTEDGVAKYDSYWDGTFKTNDETGRHLLYYTDNPAWIFYDILLNDRYGVGKWVDKDIINKFSLYRISKYCDELVDDGTKYSGGSSLTVGNIYKIKEVGTTNWTAVGAPSNTVGVKFIATSTTVTGTGIALGQEPRFRANLFFTRPTEVYKVLKDMGTVFLGVLYWLDGKITPVQDVPGEPVYTFSKSNIIDGIFNYESSGRQTRPNQVVVTWNDPKVNYEQVPLIVEDRNDIVAQGRLISETAVAMGATSEGQALRYGRWKLWTAQNQTEIVSFQTGLQGAYLRPGDIINIQDRDRYGVDFSGLVKSFDSSTQAVTFDRSVTSLSNASTWELNTVVTNFAAFYTGVDPLHIDNSTGYKVFAPGSGITTFNRGDRFTSTFWYPDATPDPGSTFDLDDILSFYSSAETDLYESTATEAEKLVSNAFVLFAETGGPLSSDGLDTGSGYNYEPLPLDWKEHTYVVKTAGTLNNDRNIFTPTSAWNSNEYPDDGTVWALYSEDSAGRDILGTTKQYRVLGIEQNDEKNTYGISAVEHYNVKYDAVDKDYVLGETPENVFPTIEDTDEDVPAPGNIYVVLKTDSTKKGEEFDIEWTTPQESYIDSSGAARTRDYSFFSEYEFVHNVPGMPSPLRTTRNSIEFTGVADGQYVFRVRTVSRKQNYSRYISTEYSVDDPFAEDVPRVVGGLPKGLFSNSTNYITTSNSKVYTLEWENDSPKGQSIGVPLSGSNSIITSLQNTPLYGIINNGYPISYYSPSTYPADKGEDGTTPDSEWYYLLYDGGACTLAYWNTYTLSGLPFMQKIPNLGSEYHGASSGTNIAWTGWRGASQSWASVGGTATLTTGSNKLKGSSTSWESTIELRDIIHFDDRSSDFASYKLSNVAYDSSEGTLYLAVRAVMENAGSGVAQAPVVLYNGTVGPWRTGDLVTFERVRIQDSSSDGTETGVDLNGNQYYVRVDDGNSGGLASNQAYLYRTYEGAIGTSSTAADKVPSSELGGTFQDYSGYVARTNVKAAKVTAIIDNETILLDRSFDESFSNITIHKLNYHPDYNADAVFGRIKHQGYDSVAGIHTWELDKVLTIDEGLVTEGLQVLVTPSTPVLLYNSDGSEQSTNVDGAITARIDSIGFKNPQFRITEVSGAGAADFQNSSAAWNNPTSSGGFFYSQQIIADGANSGESDNVPYESGAPVIITGEVRESKATGVNATGTGQITKVTSGSDGIAGKTVHLLADDYSIIYDELGINPAMNGSNNTITFTATAYNFATPEFKFTFTGAGLANAAAFTKTGFDSFATGTNNQRTATVVVPSSYDGNWGNNKNQRTFNVKVEVREQSTGSATTEAFDEIGIIGVHALEGGYWVILSNPSHTVTTTMEGNPIAEYDSQTNATGFATVINSGTTIEAGVGSEVYTPYQGLKSAWDQLSLANKAKKYVVTYSESPNVAFNKGAVSYGNDNIITIADHEFSLANWSTDTAALALELEFDSDITLNQTQGFTKSKQGFAGVSVVNKNSFESLPVNSAGNISNYTLTETSINIFMFGVSLPYYPASWNTGNANNNQIPDTVQAYWQFNSLTDDNITAATVDDDDNTNTSYMAPGSTGYMDIAAASGMSGNSASITWTFNVYVRGAGGAFVAESITTTQTITKTKGVENISASLSTGHFIFDADTNTSSPSTSSVTLTAVSTYNETANPYVTYQEGTGTETKFTTETTSSGILTSTKSFTRPSYETNSTINYPIKYTTRLYDWDGTTNTTLAAALTAGSAALLDTDISTLSASRSPADNVVIELTNDNETVAATDPDAALTGSPLATTAANIYIGGTLNNTGWSFSASALTGVTTNRNVSTGALPSNVLNITQVNSGFTSGQITITATHNTYNQHQAVFSISRTNDGVAYRIVPSVSAVTYNPNNSGGYTPSSTPHITFNFKKITGGVSSAFTGRYDINDSGSLSSGSSATHTFTATAPSSVNVKLYNASGTATLLDEETVPLIIGGEDGVSLTSTQEYYKLTNSDSAPDRYSTGTTIDTGWTTTPPQPTSSNKYLWNFNRNTKSNSTTEDTNVVLLSTLVKSIASITEAYQVHNSPTAANTSGTWYSTIAAAVAAQAITSSYPYLWNRTTIAYTDGSTSTVVYSLIAVRGNDGVSFSGTVEYYKIHNSKTNAPARYSNGTTIASGWDTTPAAATTTNRYTWNFNRSTKSDSTFTDSQPVLVSELLKSISSITEEYQKGSSATTAPTGTWYSTIAGAGSIDATNPYMWNRTTIAYTDGSANTVTTTVIAARGSDGVSYTGTAEYYKLTNSNSAPDRYSSGTTIDTGWSTSPSTPTSTNQYLWNFNRNSKSDGTFQDSAVYLITQFVQDGTPGKGISSITEQYALHTSASSAPSSGWSTTFPTISANYPYIWNRTLINYTDSTNSGYIYTLIAARGTNGTTPVKGVDYDDGDAGDDGRRTASGFVYNTVNTAQPAATSFSFSSLDFTGLTGGWTENPPEFNSTNNTIYYSRYSVIENVNNGTPTGSATGSNITFAQRQTGTSFTGLVTFHSGGTAGDGAFSTNAGTSYTTIDGGNISTNSITATQLQISNSTGASGAGINMNYNSGNPKIEISDGTNIRVILGYLS